ncbi:MAG TPA: LapA family protein [Nitrospirota bacterium]|nr:LapA family protein [Nitrospirota bacterium]
MITLVFVIIIVAVVAIFSIQNSTPVSVMFLSWHFEASLAIIILLSVLTGLIIGMIVLLSIRFVRSSRKKGNQESKGVFKEKRT